MKFFIAIVIAAFFIGCDSGGVAATGAQGYVARISDDITDVGDAWDLVWSDDFDGSSVKTEYWKVLDYNGGEWGNGNGERQYYSPRNVTVANGNLVLTARSERYKTCWYGTCEMTSGKIESSGKYTTKYGKIEARIKVPEGDGMWPAFWMLGEQYGWPKNGEIDIMELRGRLPNIVMGTLHWGKSWNDKFLDGKEYEVSIKVTDDFHVYGVEWNETVITFFLDGNKYHSVNIEGSNKDDYLSPFGEEANHDFYMLLNLAVGGTFDQVNGEEVLPGEDFTSAEMLVDWVRVSKKK